MMKKRILILIILSVWGIGNVAASNIQWYDYENGINLAENTGKPIMIFFYADIDGMSKRFERDVLNDSQVIEKLNNYICIKVDYFKNTEIDTIYEARSSSTIIFTNKNGQIVNRVMGGFEKDIFIQAISEAWNKKDEAGKPLIKIEEFDIGTKSIQELKNFIDGKKTKTVKVQFILIGTIRNLEGNGDPYSFYLDDGTGTVRAFYNGGLGDITNGDRVKVEGSYAGLVTSAESMSIVASKVLKVDSSEPNVPPNSQNSASPKTPGFEVIIGAAAMLFAWKKSVEK